MNIIESEPIEYLQQFVGTKIEEPEAIETFNKIWSPPPPIEEIDPHLMANSPSYHDLVNKLIGKIELLDKDFCRMKTGDIYKLGIKRLCAISDTLNRERNK